MSAKEKPASICIYEVETQSNGGYNIAAELDFEYVDGLAEDLAAILGRGEVAEACYQPGDGTRYALVIVPLAALRSGRPRVKDGSIWERHAVSGMKLRSGDDGADGDGFYHPSGYLVGYVDHACYPLRLEGRGQDIAAGYIAEHWGCGYASGIVLAILFRAICWHLDVRKLAESA